MQGLPQTMNLTDIEPHFFARTHSLRPGISQGHARDERASEPDAMDVWHRLALEPAREPRLPLYSPDAWPMALRELFGGTLKPGPGLRQRSAVRPADGIVPCRRDIGRPANTLVIQSVHKPQHVETGRLRKQPDWPALLVDAHRRSVMYASAHHG